MTGEIKKLFKPDELTETGSGTFKTICPDCNLQGGRTEGFILFPDDNRAFCQSSHKCFNLLETAALKFKLIKCLDGRDSGERESIFDNDEELMNETLEVIEEEFGSEFKEVVINSCYSKKQISLPNTGKLISIFAKQISKVLEDKNILFYRVDSKEIIEIRRIKYNAASKINQKGSSFTAITPNRFITLVERYIEPGVCIKDKKTDATEFHKKSLNSSLTAVLIESHILQDSLPKISRIFTVPIPIRYNGKLTFPRKGYDERFESWLPYTSPEIINTDMNLIEAKSIIEEMFSEFCFKGEDDKINAIAALITPFLKGLFKGFNTRTPVPFYIANRERAGKDYLAGITGIVYEGAALEEPPISSNDFSKSNNTEELRKKILSAMIAGRKRLHFSNNKGFINNAVFESVATSSQYSDRKLGGNETLIFDNELDLSLSGNAGVTYTPDFANRCRFVNLFLEIEDANSRKFKNPDLHEWVKNNRNNILSALYCLVRNWFDLGTPKGSLPFASFQEWAAICGGIMEAAGYDNPCKLNELGALSIGGDMETKEMKELFEACYNEHPNENINRAQILELIKKEELFPGLDFDKRPDQTKFGAKLNKYIGRVLSNIKLNVGNINVRGSRQIFNFGKEIDENSATSATMATFEPPSEKYTKNDVLFGNEGQNVPNVPNVTTFTHKTSEPNKYRRDEVNTSKPKTLIENAQNNAVFPTTPVFPMEPNFEDKKGDELNKPIEKSDRETQFLEAEECENIKCGFSKEDILSWIKENPNYDFKELYDKFGVGFVKLKNELLKENKIIEKDGGYI